MRDLKVLGDRILAKQVKGNDGKKHIVGRYLQVLYDGNLDCKKELEETAKTSYETIRFQTHRVKDFYNDAIYFKPKAEASPSMVVNQAKASDQFQNSLYEIVK